MKAYETSTMTLKGLLAHPSLQRDKVDETMEAMAEAAADHAEIEEAIKLGGEGVAAAAGTTADEEELQRELQELVDEKEKEAAEEKKRDAMERAREEQEQKEKAAQAIKEQEAQTERQRRLDEQEQMRVLIESGRGTPAPEEDRRWEQRWLAAQAEKAAQAHRDREAEGKRRAGWEEQDMIRGAQTA